MEITLNGLNIDRMIKNLEVLKKKQTNNDLIIQYNNDGEWKKSQMNYIYLDVSAYKLHNFADVELRIKPEPQYRQYSEVKEEWIGKKVNIVSESVKGIITNIKEDTQLISVAGNWYRLERMFQVATWGNNGDENDGKPFGDVVE